MNNIKIYKRLIWIIAVPAIFLLVVVCNSVSGYWLWIPLPSDETIINAIRYKPNETGEFSHDGNDIKYQIYLIRRPIRKLTSISKMIVWLEKTDKNNNIVEEGLLPITILDVRKNEIIVGRFWNITTIDKSILENFSPSEIEYIRTLLAN